MSRAPGRTERRNALLRERARVLLIHTHHVRNLSREKFSTQTYPQILLGRRYTRRHQHFPPHQSSFPSRDPSERLSQLLPADLKTRHHTHDARLSTLFVDFSFTSVRRADCSQPVLCTASWRRRARNPPRVEILVSENFMMGRGETSTVRRD